MIKPWLYFITISCLISIFGCTPLKKAQKDVQVVKSDENVDKTKDPNKNNEDTGDKPKDDITDKDVKADPVKVFDKRDKYIISLILPFNSDDRFRQYYGGMKIAAKQLEQEGINLNIDVIDASSADYLSKIKTNSHLIMGPNEEAALKSVIEYGRKNQIPVVSPFYSLSSVENNPNYIQLKPSLRSHYIAMLTDIKKRHKASDVVLVIKDAATTTTNFIRNSAKTILNGDIAELIVTDSLLKKKVIFSSSLSSNKNVFIFANHSFKDEKYIADCFKILEQERKGKNITVYGMPFIKDSDNIGRELYKDFNLRLVVSKYIDADRVDIKSFERKFYETYQDLATTDAFEGHDNLLFIGRSLFNYGVKFQYHVGDKTSNYLQTSFKIQATKGDSSPNEIDYFENKFLDILVFDGVKFTIGKDK